MPQEVETQFRTQYTRSQYKNGCEAAYRLGLMDGERGSSIQTDATGFYQRVRVHRVGRSPYEPAFVQVQRNYDDEWVSIAKCPNHELSLAMLEDVVAVLARAESRE